MQQIKLWDREIPYFKEEADTPNNMTFYPVPTWHALPTVVVFPGGGYRVRAAHEGEAIAQFFNTQGFHACVVDYRVKPNAYPAPLCDAQRAVKLLRAKVAVKLLPPDAVKLRPKVAVKLRPKVAVKKEDEKLFKLFVFFFIPYCFFFSDCIPSAD